MAPAVSFTLQEAATLLDPPMSEAQLRQIVSALGWRPAGRRYTGKRGHPFPTYSAEDVLRLHAALVPFIRNDVR